MTDEPATQAREPAREAFLEALVFDDPIELYERAPCGFLSTTPDGVIVKANATFRSWIGYEAEELVGLMSFVDLLTAGGRIYHETHYMPALRMQGQVREIAVDLRCRDGRRLPVLVNASLDTDADGQPRVIRIAVFDATERRSYERELLRAKEVAEAHEQRARELAITLQLTLVPPTPARIRDLDIATCYLPAGTVVGGDFYDIFPVGPDEWAVVIGDVLGKGVEAALVATFVRHTIRDLIVLHDQLAEVLHQLDSALNEHSTERFCTVAILLVRRTSAGWQVIHTTGGHPPPVLGRAGEAAAPWGAKGHLVGAGLDGSDFGEADLSLSPGDLLVLYTDGTIEARRDRDLYGEDRLQSALDRARAAGADSAGVLEHIAADVAEFQTGHAHDDIAMIAIAVPA